MFINTLLFLYVLWHREYPPLRAKNIKLIAILYLSMVFWYLGTIGTNFNLKGHLDFSGSCLLFSLWFRIVFGIFMFICVHVFRLYIYIRIFKQVRKVTYRQYLVGAIVFVAVVTGYGVTLSVLRRQLTVRFVPLLGTCVYGTVFAELSFALVWVGWALILVVTFIARDINTSFKEYREMLLIVLLSSISISYETVVHHVVREYTVHQWSRVSSTLFEFLTSQSSLFILLGVPVYNCMFHRDEFRRKFFEKMKADGMASRYQLTLPPTTEPNTTSQQPTL
ncbi:hypothetical protein IWW55_005753 [Coemansia sp. RSA 2706]|nr:hypothetical protein LPJ63_003208 [Coemansia sp. RSA 2711]KAJ2293297.1 hypothetical protein IWW55_005753 [Coemansia sp. RSA 2706]